MASLTNPVNPQNIVNRFADYVVATANSGISWGYNAVPFGEFPSGYFGGYTSGKGIEISGGSINTGYIHAGTIYNVLVAETTRYTKIRNLRALRYVVGYGYNYDYTAKAFMNDNYMQGISPSSVGTNSGALISYGNLEAFFSHLRDWYNAVAPNTVTIQIDVCHVSCHSSCHGSRGRR